MDSDEDMFDDAIEDDGGNEQEMELIEGEGVIR